MRYRYVIENDTIWLMSIYNDNDDVAEVIDWLKHHGCRALGYRYYRFPSEAVKNWFLLRWKE